MSFDPSKPVQTRCGYKARIVATGLIGERPIAAVIVTSGGEQETIFRYDISGALDDSCDHPFDLINIPERTETIYRVIGYGPIGKAIPPVAVIKLTWEDDRPVAVELVPGDAA